MDEETIISLVERSQKPVFGFVLSLSCAGRQEAFEIAVSSLTGVLSPLTSAPSGPDFMRTLFKTVIQRCRSLPPATGPDMSGEENVPPQKKQEVRLTKKAMFSLPFDQKCLILLRDQQHFSYDDMALILGEGPKEVKSKVLAARDALRHQMENLLG